MTSSQRSVEWFGLRKLLVATLIVLTFQGWLGDSVNLFSMFPNGTIQDSANGLVLAVVDTGPILLVHAITGLVLLFLGIIVLAASVRGKPRNIKVPAALGLLMVVFALAGGVMFVLSGFTNNGASAQMGLTYILAYASYFAELYYAK